MVVVVGGFWWGWWEGNRAGEYCVIRSHRDIPYLTLYSYAGQHYRDVIKTPKGTDHGGWGLGLERRGV